MCGIAGFVTREPSDGGALSSVASRMSSTMADRGPDDEGVWVDATVGVALGHRRLSIIDLSPLGHQPMHSACGRYVVTFNGEIYNFADLSRELQELGYSFRGHSDTEVMLSAFTEWGVAGAVSKFNGMFAFGVWDRADRTLHLVRDRVGEKPLYYGWFGKTFAFASALRAIRRHPESKLQIDRNALALYLRYTNVPAPFSIYQGIFKLPPGSMLTLPLSRISERSDFSPFPESCRASAGLRPRRYWSAREIVEHGKSNAFAGSEAEAAVQLESVLRDAVRRQMVSDVPIGALLSGGVDSSTIAALMQQESATPVSTFAIGFHEKGFDEATHASAVARHLGTRHTQLYVGSQDALDVVGRLPEIYDEPFADASQVPTYLLCALIRRHVTVALSGDGGDELFGGYNRYRVGDAIWKRIRWMPRSSRRALASLIRVPRPETWERVAGGLSFLGSEYGTQGTFGDKFHKIADVLAMKDADALYHRLVTFWEEPERVVRGVADSFPQLPVPPGAIDTNDIAARMMYLDLLTYLPDDILTKVDRASMASSLEVRVPMLDHRVVEFAWTLPTRMKIAGAETKRVLRGVLYRHVPRPLIDRPKMGFGVPLAEWLRGPLRDWAEDLLDKRRLDEDGLLDPHPIRDAWTEHLSGRRNWQAQLWAVLMFQAWHRHTHARA